jgi:hypothetical protein
MEGKKSDLRIREYADLEKKLKKANSENASKNVFSFLCEENYDSGLVKNSIAMGINDLISTLRTVNIYPIEPYVTKIAESVEALYKGSEDGPVTLFFDDMDLVATEAS